MAASKTAEKPTIGRRCLRACLLFLNCLLFLTFGVQVALIIWILPDGEVELPPAIVEKAKAELGKQGLVIDTDRIGLDLRGYLSIESLRLGFKGGDPEALEADKVLIGFSPWELLIGRFHLDDVRVLNGNLYCPAVISPTGVREVVVSDITVRAQASGADWNIDYFYFKTAGFRIALHGEMPYRFLGASKSSSKSESINIEADYREACQKILEVDAQTKGLIDPLLQLDITARKKKEIGLEYTFQFSSYTDQNDVSLGQSMLHGSLIIAPDHIPRAQAPALVTVQDIKYSDKYSAESAQMYITLNDGPKGVLGMPKNANMYAYHLQTQGLEFGGAMALADFTKAPTLKINGGVKERDSWIDGSGVVNLEEESADLTIRGRWEPGFFLKLDALKDKEDLPHIDFPERPAFLSHVIIKDSWTFDHAWVQVSSGPARYNKLNIKNLNVNALIYPDHLKIYDTRIAAGDYVVTGLYEQDFKTDDYRYIINGTVRPLDISFLVGEKWWDELWGDFDFDHGPPQASLDLKGRYDGGRAYKKMFVYADLPECTYRGIPTKQTTAYLWQDPNVLDILDLYIQTDKGNTLADLQFRYIIDGKDRVSLAFTGSSTMQPATLCQMIGPDAEQYKSLFTSKTPPKTHAAGVIFGEDSKQDGDVYLNILADFSDETVFEEMTFDKVSMQALSGPNQVQVKNIRAGFGGGELTGNANLTMNEAAQDLTLDLNLNQASLYKVVMAVPSLKEVTLESEATDKEKPDSKEEQSKDEEKPMTPEERLAGNVDMSFKGHGDPDKLESFVGSGEVNLTEANLGRLHLFGGLSRILSSVGIPFGTVDFRNAKFGYDLSDGNLHIPQGNITGDTARIEANGYYMIQADTLDFIVTLYPLGGIDMPVVSTVLSVLNPISNTIEVELKGSLSDPKWETSFGLMRAFTGQQQVQNPNEKSSDSSN